MIKKFTLTLFVLSICLIINAQGTGGNAKITGIIVDSVTNNPIEYATISLLDPANKKTVNGTTTGSTGAFTITNVAPGAYTIEAEFIGYKPRVIKDVTITKTNGLVELKKIRLFSTATTLQAVTVTTQGRLVESKIDKLVFNAEKDITSQTGVATDILRKVPQVTVGVEGNVELAGASGIRFLINGKPSSAFGSNIADV